MLLTVNVTQKHINDGGKGCNNCPIALAIKEALPNDYIAVTPGGFLEVNHYQPKMGLPIYAQLFVFDYDRYGKTKVKPFSFEIEISDRILTQQ